LSQIEQLENKLLQHVKVLESYINDKSAPGVFFKNLKKNKQPGVGVLENLNFPKIKSHLRGATNLIRSLDLEEETLDLTVQRKMRLLIVQAEKILKED